MTSVDIVKLHSALKRNGVFGSPSMAIAGFSDKSLEVGMYAKKAGFRVVAVSDDSCGIIDLGGNGGLDITKLIRLKKEAGNFKDIELKNINKTNPEFLSKIEVDVLLVGSLEDRLAEEVRAKVILELNRGVISKKALKVLKIKQVPIIHF